MLFRRMYVVYIAARFKANVCVLLCQRRAASRFCSSAEAAVG